MDIIRHEISTHGFSFAQILMTVLDTPYVRIGESHYANGFELRNLTPDFYTSKLLAVLALTEQHGKSGQFYAFMVPAQYLLALIHAKDYNPNVLRTALFKSGIGNSTLETHIIIKPAQFRLIVTNSGPNYNLAVSTVDESLQVLETIGN